MRFAFIFINDGLDGIERTSVRDGDGIFVGVRDLGRPAWKPPVWSPRGSAA